MICLEMFGSDENIKILKCLHIFHPKCLLEWLANQSLCPLCKDEQTGRDITISLKCGKSLKYSSLFNKDYIRNLTSTSGDTNTSMLSAIGKSIKPDVQSTIRRKRNRNQPSTPTANISVNSSNVSIVALDSHVTH